MKKKPLKWFGENTNKTSTDVSAAAGFSDPWGVPEEWGEGTEPAQVRVQTTLCTVTDFYSQTHKYVIIMQCSRNLIFFNRSAMSKKKRGNGSLASLRVRA